MRWDGQAVGADDGALPGLALSGLVRRVRTPDFAGVTFHEVAAKTALNKVPAASSMPFRWTINPMRGCLHACTYCLSPATLILMADGRPRPLGSLEVGDEIIGTEKRQTCRHYVSTTVLARWETIKPAYRVTLRDGTELIASGDHRFLTDRGWKHVTRAMHGRERRPHLTRGDSLLGLGVMSRVAVTSGGTLDVMGIESLAVEMPMVDITTGTGDFIANGVISHNCYARPTHEYLDLDAGADFETQIVVKTNLVEVLRAELAKPSWRREHVALGTNTDPYQRAEGRYRLMPGIIEALTESRTPFSILTKGTLLRRDLPLLARAADVVPVGSAVSLAILDEDLQQAVEPGTPTPRARLDLIRAVRDAGLPCGVFVAPVMPWLTDSVEHLDALLGELADAGATGVTVLPMHLRGSVKPWFLRWLGAEHPHLVARYRRLYGTTAYVPEQYKAWLHARVAPLMAQHGLAGRRTPGASGAVRPEEGNYPRGSMTGRDTAAAPPTAGVSAASSQPTLF